MSNYTVLHLHSMDSNPKSGLTIDSVTPFQDYILKAEECGMNAIAFTEHGSVLHNVAKKQMCEKHGIKYIHGQEFYVTEKIDTSNLVRDNYHLIMLAKNKDGVREINYLSSIANIKDGHYYYTPRIELDDVIHTSDNILILTACCAGMLCRGTSEVKEKFLTFIINNQHRCWLEIQPHCFKDQIDYNKALYALSQNYGIRMVATSDVHAVSKEHLAGRSIMQKAKNIVFHDEDECDLTWHNDDEMVAAFSKQNALPEEVYLQAIEETNNIAAQIEDYKLDYTNKYPRRENSEEEFKKRIRDGIKEHGVDKYENYETEYLPRIKEEFNAYKTTDAIDFMLLDSDYKNWMREQGMYYGPSRGSVSGSVIAWLIHSTDVDSVKYELNFSRFINKDRQSLADVDTDIFADDRYKVREYFFNRPDVYCCNIITFNTIKMRGAIKDVARAFEMPVDEAQAICNTVYEDESGKECVPDDIRNQYKKLFSYVDIVIGTITSLGRHAAGIVVSPTDIKYDFGTLMIDTDPRPVSQIDMHEIDSLNYVKMDLLGLNAVGLINKTCNLVGIPNLTPEMVDFSDENVIQSIAQDTTMIFQFESGFASESLQKTFSKETLSKIKAKNKDISYLDIMAMVSGAIRPAGESYRDALFNGEYHDNGEEVLNEFLQPTLGYLVYQEQIIEFLNKFCGFTMGQADIIRRCVDEHTLITTGYGYQKEIKYLKSGDTVISYNEYGYPEVDVVNTVFDNGIQECLGISTKNGNYIECTGSHKILTQDGYKQASELSTDDWVMVPSRIVYKSDGLKSNQRLSADTLFLIGLLLGDGYIHGDNPSYVNHEELLIEKYKQCINQLSKSKQQCKFLVYDVDGVTVDKIYTVRILSKQYKDSLNNLLSKYDMKHSAFNKRISEEIMSYPADIKLSNLLAGLFNSDGGYNVNSASIEYSSISKLLVNQIKCLLLKYGIYSYITKSVVKDYNYYSYTIHISHIDSILVFERNILPYMVGKKHKSFKRVIELAKQTKYYNYILPSKCKSEILKTSDISKKSIRSLTINDEHNLELKAKNYPHITDSKAQNFISKLYCPETYKMLVSDYIPLQITSISKVGERHVYDIEVNKNHNYIANGIIVHNCFAKKTGTEKYIPVIRSGGYIETIRGDRDDRYVPGFIQIAQEKYGMTKERAEKSIEYFLRIIEDASSYLFSKNHSVPYSMIGFYIGYLRYYYPLQLLTAALNVYKSNSAKMNEIKQYAKSKGILLKPIKFGKSRADYFMDVNENCIYSDIESIKECDAKSAEELYKLSQDNTYDNFIDLLYDIKTKTTTNKTKLDILIKLGYFDDFGDPNRLLWITKLFDDLYGKNSIKKNSPLVKFLGDNPGDFCNSETPTHIDEIDVDAFMEYRGIQDFDPEKYNCCKFRYETNDDGTKVKINNGISYTKLFKVFEVTDEEKERFATKTVYGKYDGIYTRQLLKYWLSHTQYPLVTVEQRIRWQQELLGYVDYINPELDKHYFVVMNLDEKYSPKFTAYCIANGCSVEMRVRKNRNPKNTKDKCRTAFNDLPFSNGDIIYLKSWGEEPKMKKTADGWEKDTSVMIKWMYDYDIANL